MNASLGESVIVFAVYVLAVARIVRAVNHDTIFDRVRVAVAARGRDGSRSEVERARWNLLLHWASCPWCVSIWVAAATVWIPLGFADNRFAVAVGVVLAVSMIVGVAAPLSAGDDIDFEPVEDR